MNKVKPEVEESEAALDSSKAPEHRYKEMLLKLNTIVQPLASCRLTRKLYKCIKKAVKQKHIGRSVKEVQKFLNKGEKGIRVLSGDTPPVEAYCHLPILCEDLSMLYARVPLKTDLGAAAGSKRPTCVI